MPKGDLAAQLAPHMAGAILHPGDDNTPPFPLAPLPAFRTVHLPPGMAAAMADEAGLPSPDFTRLYCQAWLHLVETVGGVELVDRAELADLRAAAQAREHRRNQILQFRTPCGATVRAMTRDFDTDHPQVPCELVNHQCKAGS